MKRREDIIVNAFNSDIVANRGYLYTTNSKLSSYLANRHLTEIALSVVDFRGKKVLDLGCGDGQYTLELYDQGQPAYMRGVDLAEEAIRVAQGKIAGRQINFDVHSVDKLPYESDSFDITHIRGVLHHMEDPVAGLREALRVSSILVVIEPNGYNPILKILEKMLSYHLKHKERSFMPVTIVKWVTKLGGRVRKKDYAGLVPFFCPDWLARILKSIESFVERLPIIKHLSCAVCVFVITRKT